MVKVIVGYKVKKGADIAPTLLRLRSYAVTFLGFISAENLRSEEDGSIIAMASTWENIENWRVWESASIRKQILQEAENLFEEEPRITVYRIMPTTAWEYTRL